MLNKIDDVRFEIFTAVTMKKVVVWVVALLTDVSEEHIASIFRVEKSSYWINARLVALDFSPPLTDTLPLIDIPLLTVC
jgi:hypothetical protein